MTGTSCQLKELTLPVGEVKYWTQSTGAVKNKKWKIGLNSCQDKIAYSNHANVCYLDKERHMEAEQFWFSINGKWWSLFLQNWTSAEHRWTKGLTVERRGTLKKDGFFLNGKLLCSCLMKQNELFTVLTAVVAANDGWSRRSSTDLECVGASSGCRLSNSEWNEIQPKRVKQEEI